MILYSKIEHNKITYLKLRINTTFHFFISNKRLICHAKFNNITLLLYFSFNFIYFFILINIYFIILYSIYIIYIYLISSHCKIDLKCMFYTFYSMRTILSEASHSFIFIFRQNTKMARNSSRH